MPIFTDAYGADVTARDAATVERWNAAMAEFLAFRGDPIGALSAIEDDSFLLGPIFCAAMRLIGGAAKTDPGVAEPLAAAARAAEAASPAERRHLTAAALLADGAFTSAAAEWDALLAERPHDLLALKCSHEVYFLVGDVAGMMASAAAAFARLSPEDPLFPTAACHYAFAAEELGRYDEAEAWGRYSLSMAETDCWALHCLAHVYEMQNRHQDAVGLLRSKMPIWREQNLLSAHIWWHLGLRVIEAEQFDQALEIFDSHLADVDASDGFRLTDGTSLLWRLELAGVDVGDRWRGMADKWAHHAERHQNGFLDMHAAFAFARCGDAPAADRFFDTLISAHAQGRSERSAIYREIVAPLVDAIRIFPRDPSAAAAGLAACLPQLHRIGGSIAQREIVERSYSAALLALGAHERAEAFLAERAAERPNTAWLLRGRAAAAEQAGDVAAATLLRRRADLMFAAWG